MSDEVTLRVLSADERAELGFVSNVDRAEAIFAIEQGLRAIERYRMPTCIEHGCVLSWCAGNYHANGKVRHGVIK